MEDTKSQVKRVEIPSKNHQGPLQGVVIGDPYQTPRGLIVIHEWWGMNEQIIAEGTEIARDGNFTVFVPDMYRGKVTKDYEEAGHYMGDLDWNGALMDISAAAEYLKLIGCCKVGVTGFCMGGALSFAAAADCPEISAAAPFYGTPRADRNDLTKITIPVQAHFGEFDDIVGFSSPAEYQPLSKRLLAAGVPYELCTYPAGHAFTNPTSPGYNSVCAEKAFRNLFDFMSLHLARDQ